MLDLNNFAMSSYARILLSEWELLRNYMLHDVHNEDGQANTAPQVLSEDLIRAALRGPFVHFYQQFIPAYAKIIAVRMELNLRDNDTFKDNRPEFKDPIKIPEKILRDLNPSHLDGLRKKLNEVAEQYHALWLERLQQWKQLVIEELAKANFKLTDLEQQELQRFETLAELERDFAERKLAAISDNNKSVDCCKLVRTKSYWVVRNALARLQQDHSDASVNKTLKAIKGAFNAIAKQEKQLAKEQQQAIDAALQPINF